MPPNLKSHNLIFVNCENIVNDIGSIYLTDYYAGLDKKSISLIISSNA